MTSSATEPSRIARADLLEGLRVQISGAVPEEEYWTQPHLNEKILAFVQRLSELVILYGGRIVHGNHPGLTPAIVGCVQTTLKSGPGGVGGRLEHTPAVTLVGSALWPRSWEFPLSPDLFSIIETPVVGAGGAKDAMTRNASLTALRLTISQEVDVVVAVGGKLQSGTGFNPGVLEELCFARWRKVPCFVIACLGGFAGELDAEIIRQLSAGNRLDAGDGAGQEQDAEMRRLASWDKDIPSMAGDLIAHLVTHRVEFQKKDHAVAGWPRIPIVEESHPPEGPAIRKAEVPVALIDQAAARFDAVLKEMRAPIPDPRKIGELLGQDGAKTDESVQMESLSSTSVSARKFVTVEKMIGDKKLSIETGRLAKQASGAVVVRVGDTMTLVATMAAPGREGLDFFPLTVDYREKVYAAGKFPGGFIKREGRPTTKEILTSRLIDRPIRPLFPESYREEIQIQAGPISADRQNDADIPTMIGASATLLLAKVPFYGPIGGVRLARVDDKLIALPTADELKKSDLDLVVASTAKAIVMIEGFAEEVPEPEMLAAIMAAHQFNQEIIALQHELLAALGLPPYEPPVITVDPLRAVIYERYGNELREAKKIHGKADRNSAVKELKNRVLAELAPTEPPGEHTPAGVKSAFHGVEERVVRELILDGNRSDGRGPRDLRPISCEVGLLPRAHGSAIFQRGETQALVTTVLGTGADEQRVDGIMDEFSKKFMLDYNMPPFAVGEIRPIRGPGRREIGHGALAERSVAPILPDSSVFPYTIRVVSDILESNGSSSMASVCGTTLSLMDAGVPINDPVGGISIGLVQDEASGRHVLLTDIIGDEDHFGDMDFKVAGTQRGVTGIQLDLKNQGITEQIVKETLDQAKEARLEILRSMLRAIKRPREEISANAPRLIQIQINPEKIGMVIGPGGKTIRRLQEETGAKIDIEDSGIVMLSSLDAAGALAARDKIQAMTEGVTVGKIYEGRVTSIKDFGAFVEILPGKDGLVHISELSEGYVSSVNDICRVGDPMLVKAISVDDQDRVKLSRKAALAERGEPDAYAQAHPASERPPAADRGRRGRQPGVAQEEEGRRGSSPLP